MPVMRRTFLALVGISAAIVAAICGVAHEQEAAPPAAFEVATVKPAPPNQPGFNIEPGPDTLTMRNVTLRQAIQFAYRLHEYQMSGGPKWVDSDGYDIVGKTDDSLRPLGFAERTDRLRAMLRKLLSERFQLAMRREMKDVPAYSLSIAKNGFRLAKIEPGGPKRIYGRPDQLVANGATIAEFVALLEARFQKPVIDHTGLEGLYNFSVQYAPENATDSPYPSIFTAIQEQCGLKLERAAAPAETFAIERVERPVEN
jgi:uncharacterized protein (TIGR03435 family)